MLDTSASFARHRGKPPVARLYSVLSPTHFENSGGARFAFALELNHELGGLFFL
jgi:hypothetical protein